MSTGGLEGLTIAKLEEALGVSRGVITYHFTNKDEIVHAVLASAIEEIDIAIVTNVRAGKSASQRARTALTTTTLEYVRRTDALRILLSFLGRSISDPTAHEQTSQFYAKYRAWSAVLVDEARASGEFRNVSTKASSALLVGVTLGIAVQAYFDADAIDVDKTIAEVSDIIVRGLVAAPSPPKLSKKTVRKSKSAKATRQS